MVFYYVILYARAIISRHFLRALITVECMGKGAKTGRTKKPGNSVCIFLQETDLYITVHSILVWCSDFLCSDDFHNITLDTFALTKNLENPDN